MVDIIKQDMTDIWAVAGDVVAPDSAKVRAGWAVEAVPRQWWNWFENRQDTNIAYMLQKGIPEWDQFTEYLTNKSYVQRNNIVYKCILTGTNKDPQTQPTYWVKAFPESSAYLETIRPLAVANNSMAYIDGSGVAQNTATTSFGRSILNVADALAARTLAGSQAAHSNLAALSAVTASTNALPYFTGTTTMGTTVLTAFARSLLDDLDAPAMRATLGLTSAAITPLQTFNQDRTTGAIMPVGAFGLGKYVDMRGSILTTGTPADVHGTGTCFGFINGGSGQAGSLEIPGLVGTYYGVIQVNGQYQDSSGLTGMSRVFIGPNGRTFTQTAASATAWSTWVENWTTGNLTKTASNVDGTAGRMLQVGDFGLGANSATIPTITNLTTTITVGFYKFSGGATGAPSANGGSLIVHSLGGNFIQQIVMTLPGSTSNPDMFYRHYDSSGNPGQWVKFYHTGNTSQIVADVTAGIQPTLNAKVNKAGDVMTGQLAATSFYALGTGANSGILYLKAVGSTTGSGVDASVSVDTPTANGSDGRMVLTAKTVFTTGALSVTGAGSFQGNISSSGSISSSGDITAVSTVQGGHINSTGNINAVSQFTGGSVQVSGDVNSTGGFNSMSNNIISIRQTDPGNSANCHLWFYNYNTSERALIYADSAGTLHIRSLGQADTLTLNPNRTANFGGAVSVGGRITVTDIVSDGAVYSGNGNSFFAADGNSYGGVWGGYLSNFLHTNYLRRGELFNVGSLGMSNMTTGIIGAVSSLQNVSGVHMGPNDVLAGSGLRYSSHNNPSGAAPPGSWRCLGWCNNSGVAVWVRYV